MAQPTLTVLPYVGVGQQTIFTANPNGRNAAADSQSTAFSTEDKAVIDAINTSVGLLGTEVTLAALNTKFVQGNGTSGTAIKVTISSDSTGQVKLATGSATIGKLAANSGVDIGDVDVLSLPSLPAGTNNIGDVDVLSLPSLPAGANAIGTVGVTSLPVLPAGDNNIGNVDIVTMPSLPAGTNNIGDVDVLSLPALPAGTNNIGDVDVLTLPALPAGTNTIGSVKITDGVSTASVRALANNALNVAITDGSGNQITSFGGGTQYAEGATAATITGTAMMMEGAANTLVVAQGTAADGLLVNLGANNDVTITSGTVTIGAGTNNIGDVDVLTLPALPAGTNTIGSVKLTDGTNTAAVLNLTTNDALSVAIVDGSGTQITSFGGGTQYTEDAVAAADPVGNAQMLIADSTPGLAVADGDNVARRGTRYGAAYTQIISSTGSFIDTFGGGSQFARDSVAGGTDSGTMMLGIRTDTPASLAGTTGDYTTFQFNSVGHARVEQATTVFHNETTSNQTNATTLTGTTRDTGFAAGTVCPWNYFNWTVYNSHASTIWIEMSNDNSTWRRATVNVSVLADSVQTISVPVVTRYYRGMNLQGAVTSTGFMANSSYTVN